MVELAERSYCNPHRIFKRFLWRIDEHYTEHHDPARQVFDSVQHCIVLHRCPGRALFVVVSSIFWTSLSFASLQTSILLFPCFYGFYISHKVIYSSPWPCLRPSGLLLRCGRSPCRRFGCYINSHVVRSVQPVRFGTKVSTARSLMTPISLLQLFALLSNKHSRQVERIVFIDWMTDCSFI